VISFIYENGEGCLHSTDGLLGRYNWCTFPRIFSITPNNLRFQHLVLVQEKVESLSNRSCSTHISTISKSIKDTYCEALQVQSPDSAVPNKQ
jgi:hypothetical protein